MNGQRLFFLFHGRGRPRPLANVRFAFWWAWGCHASCGLEQRVRAEAALPTVWEEGTNSTSEGWIWRWKGLYVLAWGQ